VVVEEVAVDKEVGLDPDTTALPVGVAVHRMAAVVAALRIAVGVDPGTDMGPRNLADKRLGRHGSRRVQSLQQLVADYSNR